jgi:hypothetical protein
LGHTYIRQIIGEAKVGLGIKLTQRQIDDIGSNAGAHMASGAANRDRIASRRQVRKEIISIHGCRGGDQPIPIRQGDKHAVNWSVLVRILHTRAVGIQIDKVANRPQCLEVDRMASLVIGGNGVADGTGSGSVGNHLGHIGRGGDGYQVAGLWR